MSAFEIISDSTCDLSEELQQKYNVRIIPGHLILPDKRDVPSFLKWETVSREQFYADLKKRPNDYTTAPANAAEFAQVFEEYAAQGKAVLCPLISTGISGAVGFAQTARNTVLEKYPDAKISVVDTLRFGPAIGLMIAHAVALRDQGKSLEEVTAYLEEKKNCFHQAGWLDDLSFVAKKGRLTHAKAFFGSLAGVKPIGEFDYNGLTTVIGKAKGAKTAYAVLMKYIEKTIVDPQDQVIFIAQTDRLEQAKTYKAMIEEKFHPRAVYINDVFPSCGINIGPGLMAAYYMGTPISADLSVERGLVEAALSEESK